MFSRIHSDNDDVYNECIWITFDRLNSISHNNSRPLSTDDDDDGVVIDMLFIFFLRLFLFIHLILLQYPLNVDITHWRWCCICCTLNGFVWFGQVLLPSATIRCGWVLTVNKIFGNPLINLFHALL